MRFASLALPVGIGITCAGLAASALAMKYGSLGGARARFAGASLYCERPQQEVGPVAAGELVEAQYQLTNLTSGPVKIYGAHTECSCTVVEQLPLEIPPGDTEALGVTVGTGALDAGETFETTVELYYGPSGPPLALQLSVVVE